MANDSKIDQGTLDEQESTSPRQISLRTQRSPSNGMANRRMVKSQLLDKHKHSSADGKSVHIYERSGCFIARGRHERRQFGESLGKTPEEAIPALFRLLDELQTGVYLPPSERKNRRIKRSHPAVLSLRQLCSDFIDDRRKHRGLQTSQSYTNRLMPVLDFAEAPSNVKRWRKAQDINREFVLGLRTFLISRQVFPNGRDGAKSKVMSSKQVQNCLETLRSMLNWARGADVRKLPVEFANPVTHEMIGPKPSKDPQRAALIPLSVRVSIASKMTLWELAHLSGSLVLPLRPEEVCGILITDVDWQTGMLSIGSRFQGSDFTKSHTCFSIPVHPVLLRLWRICVGQRQEGVLFRTPKSWERRDDPDKHKFTNRQELENKIAEVLVTRGSQNLHENDRKQAVREFLEDCGGMRTDDSRRAFKQLFQAVGLAARVRAYDLRGSVTQSMRESGMPHLELLYLTGHSVNDILNEYVGLNVVTHMETYYKSVETLLAAIESRARAISAS